MSINENTDGDKSSNKKIRIAILGAGPAGLAAGYILAKNNYTVDIYEADSTVGGMCKSMNLWGYTVDMGPHRFFSKNYKVNKLWLNMVEDNYQLVNRSTRIFYKNTYFNYPISIINALFGLGLVETIAITYSYIKARLHQRKEVTFEDFIINTFGERLYQIFFKTYSERLWGISCAEIDADWPKQRIKKFSFIQILHRVITKLLKTPSMQPKTLVDIFPYPKYGSGYVYQQFRNQIEHYGGTITTNCPIENLAIDNGCVAGIIINGQIKKYDHVISTIPLTSLAHSFEITDTETKNAFNQLKFRNTVLVYHEVDSPHLFKDQWLYIHDSNLLTLRITNFRNWVHDLSVGKNGSVIVCEYGSGGDDNIWNSTDEELISMSKSDLKKLAFMDGHSIINSKVVKMGNSYPVYNVGYKNYVDRIKRFLTPYKNLHVIGRGGSFKYNNQDHSILMGMLAAENIMGANHNLWEINEGTDYQESAIITKDGLKMVA